MLIKFFRNGKGAGAGPVGYLVADKVLAYDDNRDLIHDADGQPMTVIREPLPEVLRGNPDRFLVRVAETQWALMIAVFCVSHVPALMALEITGYGDRSLLLIAFLVMVVQFGDLLDFFFGRRIGRHKIAPGLSPKTWEGLICGVLSAAVIGALLSWITPFGVIGAALMAGIASLVGMFGNIVVAAIKRDRGVKDWSHLIPGQGGFVDQLDSVIFAAPIFYQLTKYFYT